MDQYSGQNIDQISSATSIKAESRVSHLELFSTLLVNDNSTKKEINQSELKRFYSILKEEINPIINFSL